MNTPNKIVLLLMILLATAQAAEPRVITLYFASKPTYGLAALRGKDLMESDKRSSKFRVVTGLADRGLISLEMVGAQDCYVRHQGGIIKVHKLPREVDHLFEADATWRMIQVGDGKVRFESFNYPGHFLAARGDGFVVSQARVSLEQSTFLVR